MSGAAETGAMHRVPSSAVVPVRSSAGAYLAAVPQRPPRPRSRR